MGDPPRIDSGSHSRVKPIPVLAFGGWFNCNLGSHSPTTGQVLADIATAPPNVQFWPIADIPSCTAHVRFWVQSGHGLLRNFAFAVAIGCKADMLVCTAHVCF